jgi:predicted  nucleic acid-binding Zn-ribbon protein
MSTREADLTTELRRAVELRREDWREEVKRLKDRESRLLVDLARVQERIAELEDWITLADPLTTITVGRARAP